MREHLEKLGALRLAETIARAHYTTLEDIASDGQCGAMVGGRRHLWAVLRWSTPMSLPEIGRATGGFDHSTVRLGILMYEAELAARYAEGGDR